jgi:NADH:ubiquinone oxidoreductase subunit C
MNADKQDLNNNNNDKPWYRFPLGLFVVFNQLKLVVWTSKEDTKFDYYISIPNQDLYSVVLYIKKHVFGNQSYVVDLTTYSPCNNLPNSMIGASPDSTMNILSLYLYNSRIRLHFVYLLQPSSLIRSIDFIYKNMNWLERESIEMYGTSLHTKGDSRKLLLNYFDNNTPMKKSYNSLSSYEVYYDFLDAQVQYISGSRSEI